MWRTVTEFKNKTKKKIKRLLKKKEIRRHELPPDFVFELCLRLPIHKLFEFICVSKSWFSIISHPAFSEAYYSRNPPRFLVISLYEIEEGYQRFYYSHLGGPKLEQLVSSPLKIPIPSSHYQGVTQVVNGLVCAYSSHRLDVCNIWTGEFMRLPDPGNAPFGFCLRYYIGFDPVNRLYKLLRLTSSDSISCSILSCEILTLGSSNSSWRKLTDFVAAPRYLGSNCTLIRGVLFWDSETQIISFNFTEEKFHTIQVPRDARTIFFRRKHWLAQFRGRLTLLCSTFGHYDEKMIIYMLNDNEGYSWTRQATKLPSELKTGGCLRAVGNLPTGEILLADKKFQDSFTVLYSYDCKINKLEKFATGNLPLSMDLGRVWDVSQVISCVEQNFGTMDALIHGDAGSK